jgi:hypothetical protein
MEFISCGFPAFTRQTPQTLYFLTMPLQLWEESSLQELPQNFFILNAECLQSANGGFIINCQEFETATRYRISVVVLIINDNAFGFIKWEQKKKHLEDFGLDYENPDFALFAENFLAAGFIGQIRW